MDITKKAIIIEDNLILSILYENYLKQMVFKTLGEIKDGHTAVKLVKKYSPDIVIMDIQLEGDMDGIEAMHEIRKFSNVPVIFITGNTDSNTVKRAREITYSRFMGKPISEKKLQDAVNSVFKTEEAE